MSMLRSGLLVEGFGSCGEGVLEEFLAKTANQRDRWTYGYDINQGVAKEYLIALFQIFFTDRDLATFQPERGTVFENERAGDSRKKAVRERRSDEFTTAKQK
jgi:hypothetical protein